MDRLAIIGVGVYMIGDGARGVPSIVMIIGGVLVLLSAFVSL